MTKQKSELWHIQSAY